MERKFKVALDNRNIIIIAIEVALILLYCYFAFTLNNHFRAGVLVFLSISSFYSFMSYFKSKYVIRGNELIVDFFSDEKRIYPIDKITKITYIDTSSEWRPLSREPRHQLAIYFERSFIKSIEPLSFKPLDRDSFVEAILKVNPGIEVESNEIKYKPFIMA